MLKINFNKDWQFKLENDMEAYNHFGLYGLHRSMGAPERFYPYNDWKKIDLPHDWAIALPKDLRANTYSGARAQTRYNRYTIEHNSILDEVYDIGWYRKEFNFLPEWEGKRIFLEFEGIYRDAKFWVNGVYMDGHFSGYTGHIFEITDILYEGLNTIAVRVDGEQAEGWWYEGAGIYRNVNLLVAEPVYFKTWETVVKAKIDGSVSASAILVNDTAEEVTAPIKWTILSPDGKVVAESAGTFTVAPYSECAVSAEFTVANPQLWDIDSPKLYKLVVDAIDKTEETFGFRDFAYDAEKGFFLNGRSVKINGACCHQDLGGVGVALSDNLQYYKIKKLKEMGVNAYRCAHHAPSPVLLKACDELGMLVMDEPRMFGTAPEAIRQLTDLVKRDRNHASVFMWCVGNEEIRVQHLPKGEELAKKMCRLVAAMDDTRVCTYACNNGGGDVGANIVVPIYGVNYLRNGSTADFVGTNVYHEKHPDQPQIGTEEASNFSQRDSLLTDRSAQKLSSVGTLMECWGSSPKGWVKHNALRPWYMGAFFWTGFDYHGETLPFAHSGFSSNFGAIDLCGMEKSVFYYYKAWFEDAPLLKLTPHWDHDICEPVSVCVFTNCEHITLKLNGKVIADQDVEAYDAPEFTIDYEPGVLEVVGVKNGVTYTDTLKTSGKAVSVAQELILPCEKDGDIGIIEIRAVDKDGLICFDNNQRIALDMTLGDIVGVGNGDPNDGEYEQKPEESRYFDIRSFEADYGLYSVPPRQENIYTYSPFRTEDDQVRYREEYNPVHCDDYRDITTRRDIRYVHEPKEYTFVSRCVPTQSFAYLEFERLYGKATVYIDGVAVGNTTTGTFGGNTNNRPYRFYADIQPGRHEIKVVTTLNDGTLGGMSGYCRLGKTVNKNKWEINLFNGKARLFVKYDGSYALKADFCED